MENPRLNKTYLAPCLSYWPIRVLWGRDGGNQLNVGIMEAFFLGGEGGGQKASIGFGFFECQNVNILVSFIHCILFYTPSLTIKMPHPYPPPPIPYLSHSSLK